MVIDNNFYMSLALREAWKYQGLTYPNPAVGCCVVGEHGEILGVEAHHKAGEPHAEVNALKSAYYKLTNDSYILALKESVDIHTHLLSNHNGIFKKTKLYTTLEPCSHYGKTPSCANLIAELGIEEVYIGSSDTNKIAANGTLKLSMNNCMVYSDVLKTECDALLLPFNKTLEDRFVFFKWAERLNGTTDEGTISSQSSRRQVHAMRDVCDLLVIGGGTVREDRPTLDARLVNGKAPDILILSRNKDFDRAIPLFDVPDRKVYIEDNLERIQEYKNIMIEGGSAMYTLTRGVVDYYLCYIAPSLGGNESIKFSNDKFTFLNVDKESEDIIVWMKRIENNG
ncbi:bifunctional diaminohydroxyphosphoribosylaminopyrimidine deaminase/5-amino-6-(5-phosphoribosylamino)uracil reductase RibD [Sulfurimonas paralvinellae]|uniref:Riboflavin biosynthesis protein RibD n=1 Tax=Sulfurimonas paralvinellae TaxID=317658 RepID=A0A7M1B8X9_9BACT|nr:bifunctional diaminohydroxyphosphoribosylaminopyrimidine deaminase/5-amino-6-(5-phosphoribosylamino)uracil reductase RibD [Sulfurimonas paralvinellae]QOP45278.1 bifunctional diaminohydroxyphosphoribosylaminopyrimidine deaminase/5-amino-6-(5-phosphoribosylamino)uracil reductase RibD [Sulfurimonas paralvinellae]